MRLDADAIARLYDSHADALLGFFVKRTFQPEAAMDLVADTFAAAFADRQRFEGAGEDAATAWLYGIARHRLADFLRRGRVERKALNSLGFQRRPLSGEEYERIEELAGFGALRAQLAAALSELAADQRVALQLRVVEDLNLRPPGPQPGQLQGRLRIGLPPVAAVGAHAPRQRPVMPPFVQSPCQAAGGHFWGTCRSARPSNADGPRAKIVQFCRNLLLMRAEGLEPPRAFAHRLLRPACLPIPPRPRATAGPVLPEPAATIRRRPPGCPNR
jgi:RNA polymerase sigma factor (sigma-70 family)